EGPVRHADDRGVHHRRVLVEDVLDLDAVDVLAAADEHVLGAVDDVAEALVVDAGEVAGLHPAVDERLARGLGLVPVALDHLRPLGPERAALAARQLLGAIAAHDLDVADGRRRAARARAQLVVLRAHAAEARRGLGHAPAVAGLRLGKDLLDALD